MAAGLCAVRRRAFAQFGAEPTKHRNAAEALLRRLGRHGDIPFINTLVDIGNLISIRYAMPVAVLDTAGIAGDLKVRAAAGDEVFTGIGTEGPTSPEPDEVIFVDTEGVVSARRWCWRQGVESATGRATTEALLVVEGHHQRADDDVRAARDDLLALLASHQPNGRTHSYLLSPAHPSVGPTPATGSAGRLGHP